MAGKSNAGSRHNDSGFNAAVTGNYSFALSLINVAFPLYALEVGYSLGEISVFVGASAITQMVARSGMVPILRRVADKHLLATAALLLSASVALLLISAATLPVTISLLLQGISRGMFWTANQTHAVRTATSSVTGLASTNFWNGAGSLCGPLACAVFVSASGTYAMLALAAAIGLVSAASSAFLIRLSPFKKMTAESHIEQRGARARARLLPASLMSAMTGSWRGLLNSVVPVLLAQSAHSDTVVSLLLGGANAAVLVASLIARRLHSRGDAFAALLSTALAASGLLLVALSPSLTTVAAVGLIVSGIGGGLSQILGPALAAAAVHPEQRGQAIATAGLFRAGALFVIPFGAAGLSAFMPTTFVLTTLVLVSCTPNALVATWRKRPPQD